jgi:uncharacterized protein YqfB (UPF0267 family)
MSSVDFLTSFEYSAPGFTDFVMPGCRLDVFTESVGTEAEEQYLGDNKPPQFQFYQEQEINWVNSLFQNNPTDQPQPKSPQPSFEAPIQGDNLLCFPPTALEPVPQMQSHSFFLTPTYVPPPPPSSIFIKQEQPSVEHAPIDLIIQSQPPVRVRTRTPNEIRTFTVTVSLSGQWRNLGAQCVKVSLAYASLIPNGRIDPVTKDILGGTKTLPIKEDGTVKFSNLSVSESSTKHHEKEFCLHFIVVGVDGVQLFHKLSDPFYAYSHKKVLQRRETMKLRDLSKNSSPVNGGEIIHVVGFPFKQGPDFELIFRTPSGDVVATHLEFFSETVLYFKVPPLPRDVYEMSSATQFKVTVLATNDGKLYSNPLEFTYFQQ